MSAHLLRPDDLISLVSRIGPNPSSRKYDGPAPSLPVELQLHILLLACPPLSQHRTRCHLLSRLSLVSPAWRQTAQYLLFSSFRFTLGWRQYAHCVGRHFRSLGRRADEYKERSVEERLRWLKERGVRVREMEVSLLLFTVPDRVTGGESEVMQLLKDVSGQELDSLTVRYDSESVAFLPAFLDTFTNVRHLRLVSESMSDPAPLPLAFFPTDPSCPTPARPPPACLSTLLSLTLTRLSFDRFPPLPLPSLVSLTLTSGGFSPSSLPWASETIFHLLSFTPALQRFTWRGFRPYPRSATFANAPSSLREVVLICKDDKDVVALCKSVRAFSAGTLARVVLQEEGFGWAGEPAARVKAEKRLEEWCEEKGTVFDRRGPRDFGLENEDAEDGFEDEEEGGEDDVRLFSQPVKRSFKLFRTALPALTRAARLPARPLVRLLLFPTPPSLGLTSSSRAQAFKPVPPRPSFDRTFTTTNTMTAAHKVDDDCIFCKIIKGDIPSFKLVETDTVYSFLDIGPLSKGHALVIPKYHAAKLHDLPDEHMGDILAAAKKIAVAQGVEDYNILQNNGRIAHQVVDHVHFHMIPKPSDSDKEGLVIGWPTQKADMDELKKLQEEIKGKL
ncbi:hypothetical protein JCM8097_009109 [Rhodosporidiobolus ruineniae]